MRDATILALCAVCSALSYAHQQARATDWPAIIEERPRIERRELPPPTSLPAPRGPVERAVLPPPPVPVTAAPSPALPAPAPAAAPAEPAVRHPEDGWPWPTPPASPAPVTPAPPPPADVDGVGRAAMPGPPVPLVKPRPEPPRAASPAPSRRAPAAVSPSAARLPDAATEVFIVQFWGQSAALDAEAEAVIEQAAQTAGSRQVQVRSSAVQAQLGQNRAAAVRQLLVELGVPPQRITVAAQSGSSVQDVEVRILSR